MINPQGWWKGEFAEGLAEASPATKLMKGGLWVPRLCYGFRRKWFSKRRKLICRSSEQVCSQLQFPRGTRSTARLAGTHLPWDRQGWRDALALGKLSFLIKPHLLQNRRLYSFTGSERDSKEMRDKSCLTLLFLIHSSKTARPKNVHALTLIQRLFVLNILKNGSWTVHP